LTKDQDERLVTAWEGIAKGLGDLNEIARTAIGKQWPDPRKPREATLTKLPTPEEKRQQETGNSTGPVEEWLGEFDTEEEIGPREKEFLAGQAEKSSSTKAIS
jgi:hypothetical protein